MNRNEIVAKALAEPQDAIRRALTTAIRAADPELYVVQVQDHYGDIFRFSEKGFASLKRAKDFDSDMQLSVSKGKIHSGPQFAWWFIEWQGNLIEMVEVQIEDGFHRAPFVLLMSKASDAVRSFLLTLTKFASEVEGAVLVFQDGCWKYDEDLFEDIQNSTFDNLVLPIGFAEQVQEDVSQWLGSRELYEEHGVPWKRGMILVGPPGNGKTHMIKALANTFALSILYVRGFSSEMASDAQNIRAVFDKARACAPAMLILEDLDTLVNAENRSYFLNELDGFARNTGILTVASANNPANLDPALLNRPSRFDRRYVFSLPEASERARYLQQFTSSLDSRLRLGDHEAADIASAAEGFSYAYLKELVLSSMMAWISSGRTKAFSEIIKANVGPLLEQMHIDPMPTPRLAPEAPENPRAKYMRQMYQRKSGR